MGSVTDSTAAVWLWNENVPSFIEENVHELVQKQAKLRPNALAVDAHDGTWTYAELDEAANRLAHHLAGLGVRPEDVVPLCFEKSRWAIVGILAVLKAGAAFVFLDPSHPVDRRQYIATEVEAKVIITSPSQSHLYESDFPPTFVLDQDRLQSLPTQTEAPQSGAKPSNLLYIIFTSGSTGKPKGCLIENRAFLSGSLRHAERADIDHTTRILQLASYSFDVSMLEILTALVHGSCICTPDMALMANGPAYIVNEYKITWTFMTPSLVKLMAPSMVPTLKTLALGGEPLAKVDVETWAGHVQLINGYGPSECSVAATGNTEMTPDTDPANIGFPVGGICWIVDADDHDVLLPPGEVGELLIEGPILARGYLNNQEKTDEVFVSRPAWGPTTKTGEDRRFYKTGDLAKFLSDGSIHFVGRKDTQVKLRGLRIELGEIEHNINTHPQVHHQMVILPKKGLFSNRLVALVSLKDFLVESLETVESTAYVHEDMHSDEIQAQLKDIQTALASKVPSYMVPETWIILERFPILLSGKLNRSLISNWVAEADNEQYRKVVGIDFEEVDAEEDPESTEEQLRSIISTVLNLPLGNVSLKKSFLSLGGDSITAMQVMARCRGAGLAVSVKDILRSKSITDLSLCVTSAGEATYSTEEKFDEPFELSPVQRMYFDIAPPEIDDSRQTRFNQSFFLKVERPVSGPNVANALELVVIQHSMLRVRFVRQNDKWMQVVPSKVEESFSFKIHDIESAKDASAIMAETQTSLDTQNGPIFAVRLFNTASEGQFLFMVAHHVMIDLVSWRVILRDLEEILTTGLLTAAKPIPFQNWLALQSEHANSLDISSVLPYTIPSPDFNYWGMTNKPNRMCDTVETIVKLDIAQTKELLEGSCHSAFNTEPIDILLASLVYSFSQTFSDRAVPALFREGHGREPWDDELDISGTVGWFTTMYPLYVNMNKEFNILDVIKRAKDVRHSVPANGRPYFASRYLTEAGIAEFGSHDNVEVSFDYLGLYQQMERSDALLTQVPGYQAIFEDVGKEAPRFALVEITAEVLQGQMQLLFVHNKHMGQQKAIESWMKNAQACLVQSLGQLKQQEQELTLSDLPLLSLTYEDLDSLVHTKLPEIGISDVARVESIYPSSPMQHGLLISQVRAGAEGAYEYNHTLKVETRSPGETLDVKTLEASWAKVVQRHTSLRTVFIESVSHAGLYDQVVLKTIDPKILVRECQLSEVDEVFSSRGKLNFQPGGALHRFTICHVSATTAYCKLEINHAIIDGSSIANIMADFIMAYDGRISDRNGFVFEDYIKHVIERPLNLATDYWKEYLADANPSFFPLMANWEDAVDPSPKLESVTIDVGFSPADLTDFCNERNVTLVNVFQFAWGLVLKQYIGSEDICFGYLSSGRDAPLNGIEEGVGAFITMLVSRMILDDSSSMSEALEKVADDLTRTLPNQHCGLAEIHHALKLGGQPLFNTVISFHRETDIEMLTDSSIKVEAIKGYDPTEYALSLDVGVTESKLDVTLQFWTSEFTPAQARNIGATFAEAVKATVQQSQTSVGAVDLVSPMHLDQLRQITSVYPQYTNECVHHAIEAQAAATPEAEAICSYEGSWSYKKLNEQATRLAHYLVSIGVQNEMIVPFVFEKSAWAMVSILAIHKAGGATVAFDPAHPIERIEGLLQQTESTILLTSSRNVHLFDNTPNLKKVVVVNDEFINSLPEIVGVPNDTIKPTNACYVVFTSGTTGKPKAIVLEHRNLRTLCNSMGGNLGIGPGTRALQFAAYNFDVSLQDILSLLQLGGTICVISDDERMNNLVGGINRTQANWAHLTATVIGMLKPSDVPTIRRVINGGEPLSRDIVETWADHVGFYNLYGPAETTVNQTVSKPLTRTSPVSNIGPAYGTHVWITNDQDHNRLVPMGCAGEILIEGPHLARLYLKEPEKTAAAFIEDPAWIHNFPDSDAPQVRRFYKTGDVGCLNTDGSITIVGRRDAQVKINGQRVELHEIMYQAQQALPEGYSIVVDALAIEEHTKSKTIIGFVTNPDFIQFKEHDDQATFLINNDLGRVFKELQSELAKVLPLYMIPSVFVPVFDIPYTTSGKLARPILRQIVAGFDAAQVSHYMLRSTSSEQPRTATERVLQALFSEILSVDAKTVSRDDNFFGLGGDSVGGMKMVAAARKHNITIRVADIFKHPILSELAEVLDNSQQESSAAEHAPFSLIDASAKAAVIAEAAIQSNIDEADIEDVYPTSALQEGMMALGLRQGGAYVAQKAFRLPGEFDVAKFKSAWLQVIKSEAILRTRIVTSSSGTLQVVSRQPLEWQHHSDLDAYLAEDEAKVFQFGEPLMRLAMIDSGYFVWTAHHAIYDGWTVPLLFSQVAQVYAGAEMTQTTPFKTFIGHLGKTSHSANAKFWKDQFTTAVSFPTNYPEVPHGYVSASKKSITVSGIAPAVSSNILPSTIKRAAWALTLATYADSEDIVFAQTLAGRNIPLEGIDSMMGPTITTIPVRVLAPKEGLTIEKFLDNVQSQSIASIDYEHFGLQNIRDVSAEARTTVDSITNLFAIQPAEGGETILDMEPIQRLEENFDTYPLVALCNLGKDNEFSIEALYDDAIIPTEQMTRMLHQFVHYIQELSGDATRPIQQLSLLNQYDFKDVATWNAELPDTENDTIPNLIAQNVLSKPDGEAVCAWDGSLTYRELDILSAKVANHLVTLGVGPEVKVGLCYDKSMWNIVAMYAVIRCGGVSVQLLPSYPVPRLTSILEDIEANVVLVSPQHAGLFDGLVPNVLAIERSFVDALPTSYSTFNAPKFGPETSVFIVFTSGSTGKPKGVVMEHRGFCSMAKYLLPELLMYPDSRVLQFSSHAWDNSLFESFAPLTIGATVCIPSEHDRMNNLPLAINTLKVDWVVMVASLGDSFHPDEVPGVKVLALGGEKLRPDIHARWSSRTNLITTYGPAECTIIATMKRSYTNTPVSTIGKGIGCRTWVVDKEDHNRLVPVGCPGELLIEGPIVGRGYLNNPAKTDESFIYNPTWASQIANGPTRLYKTGDLVRYTDGGNITYLDRKDTQIKIRGLRVELSEIEHHIQTSSFGKQQAVEKIYLRGNLQDAALAAFVVPDVDDVADASQEILPLTATLNSKLIDLQKHIAKSLSAYMVPSLYIPLLRIPQTGTNKMDRNALKKIGASLTLEQIEEYSLGGVEEESGTKRACATPMEIALQGIWAELLRIDPAAISANDNFFGKGGDSLKAMRLTSLARYAGIKLIVADIFKNPVLCDMATVAVSENGEVAATIAPFSLAPAETSILADAAEQCKISTEDIEDIYPCTPLQEGLMELATQQQGAYTAQRVFRIQGEVDIVKFKNAWAQLVALHPILRTRIVLSKTSGAVQVVIKEELAWQSADDLPKYLASDKSHFVSYGSPLARYALDAENKHFIWTLHHALYDGHSEGILMEQLQRLYDGEHIDEAPGYNRFIKLIKEVNAEDSKAFWSQQLGQGTPSSFPSLPNATYQPSPDSEVTRTINIVRDTEKGFMLSTILRAAWAIVTARSMGTEDVAFAATNSGRNAAVQNIESIMGPTITTVPIQLQTKATASIADFLATVQQQSTEMITFEHAGIQNIYAMTGQKQNLKNLFVIQQSMNEVDSEQTSMLEEVIDKELLRGFHTYAAVMDCILVSENRIDVELKFDHKALPEAFARIVVDQFEHVVQQLIGSASSTLLKDIALVTPAHYQQMVEWNNAIDTQTVEDCVHNIFHEQAKLQPDAVAITSWDGDCTYKQLDELTDKLAAYLVTKGVQPEYLTPMCFEKSKYTVIAMMATLKAGGACVHLGRNSPIDRMSELIEQTGANLVLTDSVHASKFDGITEAIVVDQALLDSLSSTGSLPTVSSANPAFVLFTSGSTGKPKGVVVEHGSLCTSARANGNNRKIGPETRVLQFAAYTFDVSVADIFTTLQRGGCICVPSEDERMNDLAGAINRMKCNYGNLTPTVAGMLDPKTVPTLKKLLLGGELLTQDNVQRWAPVVDLITSYGMTECSIHCVDAVPLTTESDPADLGRPSGCHMWIVDPEDHNKLAPMGVIGELVIEGRLAARGYLGDKAKTDAAFIHDPTWSQGTGKSRRMYKTGDLCRYSSEGTIIYVSRRDSQVKHHGQRIELSEIEHNIVADTRVKQAVVLLPKAGYLQKKLIAVISLESLAMDLSPETQLALVSGLDKGMADVQIAAVRNYMATKIPDYMIPAIWIAVRALPLTANNKLDRVTATKWLVDMDDKVYESILGGEEEEGGAPATEQQQRLHDILAGVLGLPSINMKRSFLELGGDSITAMQLRAKAQAAGISMAVREIITCESISRLAIQANFFGENETEEVIGQAFPLTSWQKALIDNEANTLLLPLASSTTVPKLVRAIEALVQQHSMLRARFARDSEGQWSQSITQELTSSYHFEVQAVPTSTEINAFLANIDSQLNIENGPLFSIRLFDVTEESHQILAISAHPLIADSSSVNIIVQDLRELLEGRMISAKKGASFQDLVSPKTAVINVETPAIDLSAWQLDEKTITSDIVETSITLPSGITSTLLGAANDSLSTQPIDILVAVLSQVWSTVFGRASSIAIQEDSRAARTVGQFNRIRQLPESSTQDFIQLLSEIKDSRASADLSSALARPVPAIVEMLVESIEHTALGGKTLQQSRPSSPQAVVTVSTTVANGEVSIKFSHSSQLAQQSTLATFITICEKTIPNIASMLTSIPRKPTLSDFPLLALDYTQLASLEKVLADINVPFSNVSAIVPSTHLQQRMINAQIQTPGSYQSDTAHKITSGESIDIALLQSAWKQVVARHEALRTVFIPSVSRTFASDQIILKTYDPVVDVIECDQDNIQRIIDNHHTVSHTAYKPHVGFTIFQTRDDVYTKLEISHALEDGMSTRIIYKDLVLAYQGLLPSGNAPAFREYVEWLSEQDLTASDDFWTSYLSDVKPCHIERKVQSETVTDTASKGEYLLVPIDMNINADSLAALCKTLKITSATLFQAAWVAILRTFTQSPDVLFGYVTANREVDIPGVDDLVGPLINMLACRLALTPDTTSKDLIQATHKSFLETLEYQHGFVAAANSIEQSIGRALFNTVLSIEYVSGGDSEYYNSSSSSLGFETFSGSRAPEFDLGLAVVLGEKGAQVQIGYWNGVMDEGLMRRISQAYSGVIEQWVDAGELESSVESLAALRV